MAPPLAAPELTSPITTRSPRTSLIDAEWEWLARRAEPMDASDGVAFAERDTAPGLAPFTPTPATSWPHEAVPTSTAWLSFRLKIAFAATALCSFALGLLALPLATLVAQQVEQAEPDHYLAQLERPHANELSATLVTEPIREAPQRQEPQHESAVPAAVQPEEAVTPVRALPPSAAAKPTATRSARRHWSPPPRRTAPSDNPY